MATQQQNQVIRCPNPPIDHLERHGYLFGYPIAHSMSSLLHQTVFDSLGLNWSQKFLPSTDMDQFLALVKDPRLYGAAVTMPHKVAIIPHLDRLTEECQAVGACNTIFRDGAALVGANTDTIGIRDALLKNLPAASLPSSSPEEFFRGRPGLVIGGGGAARSACYALVRLMGFRRVYLVNRDAGEVAAVRAWCGQQGYGEGLEHVATVTRAEELMRGEGGRPGAVVACVPDLEPVTDAEWAVREIVRVFLKASEEREEEAAPRMWLEMAYHPSPWTRLAALAREAGWHVVLGTEAMIYQGLQQHHYWHGRTIDRRLVEEVKEVIAAELSKSKL